MPFTFTADEVDTLAAAVDGALSDAEKALGVS